MEFKWKQLIELMEKTFEVNGTTLAHYFSVDKSTISHLYSGKTKSSSLSNGEIYKLIFDPTYPKSLACEKNPTMAAEEIEKSLLDTLKQIIECEHWAGLAEGADNDYKKCVMKLIDLAKTNSSKPSPKKEKISRKNISQEALSSNPAEGYSSVANEVSSTNIPPQYKKCSFCEYFHIAKTVHKNITDVSGTCTLYKQIKNSSSPACKDFLINKIKINLEKIRSTFP